jgi:hypothetical protein
MRRFAAWLLVFVAWSCSTLFSTPAFAGMVATPAAESSDKVREALARSVRETAQRLGVGDRIPERALAAATVPQLTVMLDAMNSDIHAGYGIEFALGAAALCVLFVVFMIIIFTPSGGGGQEPQGPPPPPKDPIPAIRNTAIKIIVTSNFTYTPKGEDVHTIPPDLVLGRLNVEGKVDGNTFSIANGEATNFNFVVTINNDGNDRFSGSIDMSGWGWGHIATIYSGPNTWASAPDMIEKMTTDAYVWIHGGWHENR